MKSFTDKIRELANLRDLSQTEVAKRSGLSTGIVSQIFSGQKTLDNLNYSTVRAIAHGLGVHARYLVEEDIISPNEIMPRLPQEIQDFILHNNMALPWMKLARDADSRNISPQDIQIIIDMVSRKMSEKDGNF